MPTNWRYSLVPSLIAPSMRFMPTELCRSPHLVHETKRLCAWKGLSRRVGFERQLMCQLEDVEILYAFHFDSLPKNEHEHEHGSYHVPWNSRNVEMRALCPSVSRCSFLHQKPDLPFLGLWPGHEFPYGVKHDLELSIVSFFEHFQLASQILVSCDHFP
jgi:hypothetical protein